MPPSLLQRTLGELRLRRNNKPRDDEKVPDDDSLLLDHPVAPRWTGWAVAGLIAAGPALTIGGAEWIRRGIERGTERLEAENAPRQAAAIRAAEARSVLRSAMAAPPVGPTLDTLATALPQDDRLAAASVDGGGVLRIEIATVDPDRLRAAIRRTRLGALREVGQQRGEGVLLVRWEGRPG